MTWFLIGFAVGVLYLAFGQALGEHLRQRRLAHEIAARERRLWAELDEMAKEIRRHRVPLELYDEDRR